LTQVKAGLVVAIVTARDESSIRAAAAIALAAKEDLVIVHGRLKVASGEAHQARGARRAQRCRFRPGIDGPKVEAPMALPRLPAVWLQLAACPRRRHQVDNVTMGPVLGT
jgi:hypothetical protein